MWPFFLARKQLFPPRRFPVFAIVSILGVTFGVTALLVVQTVMFSFGEEHRKRIRESVGDVVVHAGGKALRETSHLVASLAARPEVAAVAAYTDGSVVVQLGDGNVLPIMARGIDAQAEAQVTPLARYLQVGDVADFDDERVMLGSGMAYNLHVGVGDRITVLWPGMLKKILSQSGDTEVQSVPLPKELEVCAILETGFTPADEKAMYVTRRTAEELFGLPRDSAGAVHMKLKDSSQAAAFAERLDAELNFPMRAVPWSQFQKAFLDAVAMEKEMLFFLMFIILLVAAFSIGSTLFNHVVRRTREIGLLGALGGRPSQILRLFVAQGLLVGILGFAAGSGLAVLILHFRQQIVQLMRMQDTLVKQYLFTKVPLYYNIDDFIKTAVLTIILMIAASLLPALWAARRKPSEAMRHVG